MTLEKVQIILDFCAEHFRNEVGYFRVFCLVAESGKIKQSEVFIILSISRAAAGRAVGMLGNGHRDSCPKTDSKKQKGLGYINSKPSKIHSAHNVIFLSPKGKKLYEELLELTESLEEI